MGYNYVTIPDRFWSWVSIPYDSHDNKMCWPWKGATDKRGYGRFGLDRRHSSFLAHVFAYDIVNGPIPKGLELDHLCRNHSCVNPAHLEAVTHRENIRRGDMRSNNANIRKSNCPKGHPYEGHNVLRYSGERRCRICKNEQQRMLRRVR